MSKAINKRFYGDDVRWFVATVVDHHPPQGMEGRVQIRIRGIHSTATSDVPQYHLPWAQVMVPTTEEGSSGLGLTPKLMTGAQVIGIFIDGVNSQVPVILGSFNKVESLTPLQRNKLIAKAEFEFKVGTSDKFGYIDSQEELFAEFKNINRPVTEVVVHWTETYTNKDLSAEDIDRMEGGIQFHYVIRRDGTLQRGLSVNSAGTHTATLHDTMSIAVVLVGGLNVASGASDAVNFKSVASLTRSQLNTLEGLLGAFYRYYPGGQVIGRGDLDINRQDPGFNVRQYCQNVFKKPSRFTQTLITRGPFTESEINQ